MPGPFADLKSPPQSCCIYPQEKDVVGLPASVAAIPLLYVDPFDQPDSLEFLENFV